MILGRNQQLLKLFVILFLGTSFIFVFSHFGAKAFENVPNSDKKYGQGTGIGALDVSGLTKEETKSLLEEKYVDWLKEESMVLQYGEVAAVLDINDFHFDAEQTIDSIKEGQKNKANISIGEIQVDKQLQFLFPQVGSNQFDLKKLTESLNQTASNFEPSRHSYDLYNDYQLAQSKKEVTLHSSVIDISKQSSELQTFIERNPTIELKKETTFSILELAKKYNIEDLYTLDILATGIYQAVLSTNMLIVERNISFSLPQYAEIGLEAKVNPSRNIDLVVSNPNKFTYKLELQLANNKLIVSLKGEKLPYTYKISTKDEQTLKTKTIVQYSPQLLPGKMKVLTKGTNGSIIKVYRDVYQGGALLKSEFISEDYYPPTYQVEIHGLAYGEQKAVENSTSTLTNEATVATTSNQNLTTSTEDTNGQQTTESDLWGIPNEQPK